MPMRHDEEKIAANGERFRLKLDWGARVIASSDAGHSWIIVTTGTQRFCEEWIERRLELIASGAEGR